MASRSLDDLVAPARRRFDQWLVQCHAEGIDVLVYCSFRNGAEQDELYKIGRSVKGQNVSARKPMGDIVTNARAGESWHNYRCAVDAVPLLGGKPQWGDASRYKRMGEIAESCGLEWAGRWTGKLREEAHFQYTGGLTLAQLRAGAVVA